MDRVSAVGPNLPFPDGFLWGTATAAHQVEGHNRNNDWWAFEQVPDAIARNQRSGLACDWWKNAERDFDRMAAMGHTTHRLSVEWSRIEPQDGIFDHGAVARYREMLEGLRDRGIEPMVTLLHFTSPLWLARRGGWSDRAAVRAFRRYVRYVVEQLGDLVGMWCTINEPNVYGVLGYLFGQHAPGRRSLPLYFRVLRHLLEAHAAAYRVIRSLDGGARAGIVKNVLIVEPLKPADASGSAAARLLDHLFNGLTLEAVQNGRLGLPLGLGLTTHGPLADSLDFFGLNYYYRLRVRLMASKLGKPLLLQPTPGAEVSDSGRSGPYGEVYPAGMYRVLKRVSSLRKPIFVTESGLPDADDDQRPRFLLTHLAQVQRAIAEGVDVRGYYHWSFTDNFEWAEGWDLRFGLLGLDEATQVRTPRPSAELYSQIIRNNGITRGMLEEWAPEALADVFGPDDK